MKQRESRTTGITAARDYLIGENPTRARALRVLRIPVAPARLLDLTPLALPRMERIKLRRLTLRNALGKKLHDWSIGAL